MILIVDLCYREHSLGYEEFVLPIAQIIEGQGTAVSTIHYNHRNADKSVTGCDGVVLCGTPLQDNVFLLYRDAFSWLADTDIPLLGICAGMQAISLAFGGEVFSSLEIGMTDIRATASDPLLPRHATFLAYELHGNACTVPPMFAGLAESDRCIQVIRHEDRPVYGVLFHPEVRNEGVVERFISLFCR
jgi:GMP synthase-like glutamine amidotransferase